MDSKAAWSKAVTNVVSNAIKFTEPGGFVRIDLGVVDRGAEIAVADYGVGHGSRFTIALPLSQTGG